MLDTLRKMMLQFWPLEAIFNLMYYFLNGKNVCTRPVYLYAASFISAFVKPQQLGRSLKLLNALRTTLSWLRTLRKGQT